LTIEEPQGDTIIERYLSGGDKPPQPHGGPMVDEQLELARVKLLSRRAMLKSIDEMSLEAQLVLFAELAKWLRIYLRHGGTK